MIDYFLYIDARLVVTIYDLLLASILGICDSDASVAYPFPFVMTGQHATHEAADVSISTCTAPSYKLGTYCMRTRTVIISTLILL